MRHAIIEDGKVSNIIEWDGVAALGDLAPVLIPDDVPCAIGYLSDGATFVPPAAPPVDLDALAASVRAERDGLIGACDWTQLADVPKATRDAWTAYRANLRAVPQQKDFPQSVAWPTPPGG